MMKTRRDILRLGVATTAALPLLAGAARAATTHTVTIQNFAFSPANLQIAAGDTVTWVNQDSTAHSAWESTGNAFDTGLLQPGQSASLTFAAAGAFNYRCRPHGNMRGSITIS